MQFNRTEITAFDSQAKSLVPLREKESRMSLVHKHEGEQKMTDLLFKATDLQIDLHVNLY